MTKLVIKIEVGSYSFRLVWFSKILVFWDNLLIQDVGREKVVAGIFGDVYQQRLTKA